MTLFFKNMDIVVPGDVIAKGSDYKAVEGAFRRNDMVISEVVGILYVKNKVIRVVPLEGSFYMPKVGDIVIGIVIDFSPVSWTVDIRAPYVARLEASDFLGRPLDPSREDITRYLDVGDLVIAKVALADRTTNPQLIARDRGLGKIVGGKVVLIPPPKVPRVLGKNQSMIKMIREITGAEIRVGNNGVIWIHAKDDKIESIVIQAIKKIERESHTPGLTERVREFLIREIKG